MKDPHDLMALTDAARWLRVSRVWLGDEARAGRLPAIKTGAGWLFHGPTVAAILRDRAAKGEKRSGAAEEASDE